MSRSRVLQTILAACFPAAALAAISSGLVSDFQDSTTQDWNGGANPANVAGGQGGVADRFLRIGGIGRMATRNGAPSYSGPVDSDVVAVEVDMMRPAGDAGSLNMRIVMFGPGTGNRWTSTDAQAVPPDGVWRTYLFSMLEEDLTRVLGSQSYAVLLSNVNRFMFRHDPGPPSATGAVAAGTLRIDNVRFFGDGIFSDGFE